MENLTEKIRESFHIVINGQPPYRSPDGTRQTLAEFFKEIGFDKGAEIGVFRGQYSEALCHANPNLHLFSIDPWLAFRNSTQARMDARYIRARRRLRHHTATILKKTSMDALVDIPDKSLDFVYIDAMHEFDFVMTDIIAWSGKVKQGGIVAGHDYQEDCWWCGVMSATQAYVKSHKIEEWYITCEGSSDLENASWFWIKP